MTYQIPIWLIILFGVPLATLIIGFWAVMLIAAVHFIKTAHFDSKEE